MSNEDESPEKLKEYAKGFLAFQYAEVKDLTKQFLTVVAAVLAVTITFSEKIVNFANAPSTPRALIMFTWGACIAAFMLGGCAIFFIYNAGVLAKNTEYDGKERPFRRLTRFSHLCLIGAGALFVLALLVLVAIGFSKAL